MTRADFYVGRGNTAEWIGSINHDGYPCGIPISIRRAKTLGAYRSAVSEFLTSPEEEGNATLPEMGWPWPWIDSNTTDYAYAYDDGKVWYTSYGKWRSAWHSKEPDEPEEYDYARDKFEFPNMESKQRVTFGTRSGLIIIGSKP